MWNATSGFIEEKDFDTGLYGNVNGEILIGGEKKLSNFLYENVLTKINMTHVHLTFITRLTLYLWGYPSLLHVLGLFQAPCIGNHAVYIFLPLKKCCDHPNLVVPLTMAFLDRLSHNSLGPVILNQYNCIFTINCISWGQLYY